MRLIDADNLFNNKIMVVSNSDQLEAIEKIMDIIKEAPTIEAEPVKHGKWIKVGDNSYKCSQCNEISCCEGNFCTDCGAKMDEVDDED